MGVQALITVVFFIYAVIQKIEAQQLREENTVLKEKMEVFETEAAEAKEMAELQREHAPEALNRAEEGQRQLNLHRQIDS